FSMFPATATITVIAVNDAPVLPAGATVALPTLRQPAAINNGISVAAFVASIPSPGITDADDPQFVGGAPRGIAVTFVDASLGTWQYSLNGGAAWLPFTSSSDSN